MQSTSSVAAALMELNEAVESYQMGNRPEALQTLLSIATTPQYPQAIQQEARIYIGEILYLEGNTDGAREYFLETLMTDADYNIDRFRHPPKIVQSLTWSMLNFDNANLL